MTAPTEQQLKDPTWWAENLEPWAVVVAVETDARGGFESIQQRATEKHSGFTVGHPDNDLTVYKRPTKPAAPEWNGEGYPPVGWYGECTWGQKANWFECVILPHGRIAHGTAHEWRVVDDMIGYEFRSIHALKEQTIEAAHDVINSYPPDQTDTAEKAFGVLYDAGMLRKGDE